MQGKWDGNTHNYSANMMSSQHKIIEYLHAASHLTHLLICLLTSKTFTAKNVFYLYRLYA